MRKGLDGETVGQVCVAAVDADFIFHVAEIDRKPSEVVEILRRVLTTMKLHGVVHPLVYKKELTEGNEVISNLFTEGVLETLKFEDILQGDGERTAYYEYLVQELYYHLKGEPLFEGESQDVFTYWKRRSSLGEIHSVAMCLICNFGLFLSDDRDSKALKQIVKQKTLGKINIYNRQEALECCKKECGLSKPERRAFAHR